MKKYENIAAFCKSTVTLLGELSIVNVSLYWTENM